VAVDRRFNPSDFSLPVKVELPDIIPPLAPVIELIRSTSQGVKISWGQSASDDVIFYQLLRRPQNITKWDTIITIKPQDSLSYVDKNLEAGREYLYSVVSIDKAKLTSPLASPVSGRLINNSIKLAVTDFKAEIDRTDKNIMLRWKYAEKNVTKFLIYRAVNDEPLSLYKSVPGNRFNLKDVDVRIDTSYNYRIKVVFVGGNESTFSEPVQVKF
jgi:fibronectin type 3 domain-containing protein